MSKGRVRAAFSIMGNGEHVHDDHLVMALAQEVSVAKAAEIIGVSPNTLRSRLQDESFAARVREARDVIFECNLDAYKVAVGKAIVRMTEIVDNPQTKDRDAVGAANAIFKFGGNMLATEKIKSDIQAFMEELQRHGFAPAGSLIAGEDPHKWPKPS